MNKRVNREARFLLRGILRMPSLGLGKQQIAAIERIMDGAKDQRDPGDWRSVAHYDYTEENGVLLYRVYREERIADDGERLKRFFVKHPEGSAGMKFGYGGKDVLVPFHLPKVLAAWEMGEPVVVVEGEKDVLAVERETGLTSTCCPGGAGHWPVSVLKHLADVPFVLVIADHDKAGYHHARELMHWRERSRPKVRSEMVSVPIGKDFSEFLESTGPAYASGWLRRKVKKLMAMGRG